MLAEVHCTFYICTYHENIDSKIIIHKNDSIDKDIWVCISETKVYHWSKMSKYMPRRCVYMRVFFVIFFDLTRLFWQKKIWYYIICIWSSKKSFGHPSLASFYKFSALKHIKEKFWCTFCNIGAEQRQLSNGEENCSLGVIQFANIHCWIRWSTTAMPQLPPNDLHWMGCNSYQT